MKIFKQLATVLFLLLIGEYLNKLTGLPIPGGVIAMIILFILLILRVIKLENLEDLSSFILNNLAFFFIPPGVALISAFDLLNGVWLKLIFVAIFTTILVMIVSGWVVQLSIWVVEKNGRNNK